MIPDLAWWGRLLALLAVEAALLVALAAAACQLTRRVHWRRLIWQSVLVAVALVWSLELAGARAWVPSLRPPAKPTRQLTAKVVGETPIRSEEVTFEFPMEPVVAVVPPPKPAPSPRWWPGVLWLAGMGALLLKLLGGRAWLAWRSRPAPAAPPVGQTHPTSVPPLPTSDLEATSAGTEEVVSRLRVSLGLGAVQLQVWPQLRGPVAFGLFRPTVAVPVDFEERFTLTQREAMLAHELAHLANRDPFWLLVTEFVCALAWWHPAVWWARRQFRAACEAAADEASTFVPGGRVALAEALVNFGRELTTPRGVGVGGSGLRSELARRVKALVERPGDGHVVRASGRWVMRSGLVTALAALLLVPWPGDRNGMGPLWAAAKAEVTRAGKPEVPVKTVTERLADPQFRQVVDALEPHSTNTAPAQAPSPVNGPATNAQPKSRTIVIDNYDTPPWMGFRTPSGDSSAGSEVITTDVLDQGAPEVDVTVGYDQGRLSSSSALAFHETSRVPVSLREETRPAARRQGQDIAPDSGKQSGETRDPALDRQRTALDTLRLPSFEAKGERLDVVVQRLTAATKAADPRGIGLNFIIVSPDENTDLSAVLVTMPRLAEARLADVIAEVVKGADGQITVGVQSYAIVFGARAAVVQQLHTRLFRVNTEAFLAALEDVAPLDPAATTGPVEAAARKIDALPNRDLSFAGGNPGELFGPTGVVAPTIVGVERTNLMANVQVKVREFIQATGIHLPPAEAMNPADQPAAFFNDRSGSLFVRATAQDLDRVEQAIQKLNLPATLQEFQEGRLGPGTANMPAADQGRSALTTRQMLSRQIEAYAAQLAQARTKYTEDHPNVAALRTNLAALRKQAALMRRAELLAQLEATEKALTDLRTRYREKHPRVVFMVMQQADLKAELKTLSAEILIAQEPDVRAQSSEAKTAPERLSRREPGLPKVQLSVFFAEIAEGSADDIGLDWLFGQAATNNPAVVSSLVTNLPGSTTPLQGDRLRVDQLTVEGQSAVLSSGQFAALRKRLDGRSGVDFMTAPQVTALSGRQAQVTVSEIRTVVTGVMATNGSETNSAGVQYVTDQIPVGPVVDLFPSAEDGFWRVKVVASISEFLGYDQPAKTNRVEVRSPGAKSLYATPPLPHLRVRQTQSAAVARPGDVIALRGPLADDVLHMKDKVPVLGDIPMLGRLFRSESTSTLRKRVYVFVQPVTVEAQAKAVVPDADGQ